ncbi:MAG: TaqI-like C-terminal specificity domain-containing protein, partial [Actinomycetes bacterium]
EILGKAVPEERRGFDAVIGNPPYLKIEHVERRDRDYYSRSYATLSRRFDVYGLFLERAVMLLRERGEFGMIIPSTMLNNLTFAPLRKMLLDKTWLRSVVNLGGRVFANANNDTVILLWRAGAQVDGATEVIDVPTYGRSLQGTVSLGVRDFVARAAAPGYELELRVTDEVAVVISKMTDGNPVIGDSCACFQGFVTGGNDAYLVDDATIAGEGLERDRCRLAVFGDEIARYGLPTPRTHVIYLTRDADLGDWPHIQQHLEPFKSRLEKKREVQMGRQPWYALHWPRVEANFERPEKILVQAIRNLSLARRVVATVDRERLYADHTLNVLYATDNRVDLRAVLAVLNSTLVNWYFRKKHIDINIKGLYLIAVPLPRDLVDSTPRSQSGVDLATLADCLLNLRLQCLSARSGEETARIQREADVVDRQIDRLVYDLYGITDDEIALVEAGVSPA